METENALGALAALAHAIRLTVFRQLVQAGPEGMAAGRIAERMQMPASSLSFHLKELHRAGLLTSRQDGRSIIYMARYETMNALLAYLTDNCCGGNPCSPIGGIARTERPARARRERQGVDR
ncbi:metalloregulator ArsR/SmtB family transcription factor [Cupriavidus respiraculi]|uniref:ArsR/SmtB family transcription factor n=1 Tax=Cupriavidus respiraculi TaxID=195930 RepID=UPI001C961494|nr:metalloregulator ArsR/SmtB family transcription factor [Cupriavidus respiraculi]MBY4946090.1 metalloregulator ArsR/SmtB family transcription factor [Cupriavidus respiraculi]